MRQNDRFPLLGTQVSAVTNPEVLDYLTSVVESREQEHVVCCTVNMIMRARADPLLRRAVDTAGIVVPDGRPLARAGLRRASRPIERFRGADVVHALADIAAQRGYRCYFYGGPPGVADQMAKNLEARHPGLPVAGTWSPPFRPLEPDEDAVIIEMINNSRPDIIFVGLGCPKQEKWMLAHRGRVKAPLMIGVGAAFDFIAGSKSEVPPLFRHNLEWLWRFVHEPRRLWRRVVVEGPQFFTLSAIEGRRLRNRRAEER